MSDQSAGNSFNGASDGAVRWHDKYLDAAGLERFDYQDRSLGDVNAASRLLLGYGLEITAYAFPEREDRPESLVVYIAKSGHIQDDYYGDPKQDAYVSFYAVITHDADGQEQFDAVKTIGCFEALPSAGTEPEALFDALSQELTENYPAIDPVAAAKRYLYGQ
jgi:hypothetical protein